LHTALFIIAGVFAAAVMDAPVVRFGWSISTQHRDHDVAASGPLARQRVLVALTAAATPRASESAGRDVTDPASGDLRRAARRRPVSGVSSLT
jgi:hypothetical protein